MQQIELDASQIEERIILRVGGLTEIPLDVRFVAATNKDIEAEVDSGRFRADLYYRLNVLPIYIPPLRERREDIPPLAEFFLKRFNREIKKQITGFTTEAMQTLLSYSWPGNVRELENAIERAVVVSQTDVIHPEVFALETGTHGRADDYGTKSLKEAVNVFKKHYIRQALERNEWNQTRTSKQLGIQRTYLSRLVKELEIAP